MLQPATWVILIMRPVLRLQCPLDKRRAGLLRLLNTRVDSGLAIATDVIRQDLGGNIVLVLEHLLDQVAL
jgi:hypothetical protein